MYQEKIYVSGKKIYIRKNICIRDNIYVSDKNICIRDNIYVSDKIYMYQEKYKCIWQKKYVSGKKIYQKKIYVSAKEYMYQEKNIFMRKTCKCIRKKYVSGKNICIRKTNICVIKKYKCVRKKYMYPKKEQNSVAGKNIYFLVELRKAKKMAIERVG